MQSSRSLGLPREIRESVETEPTTNHDVEGSPQIYARVGGVLYLIIIVLGLFGESFVRDRLIVSGNAAATAENIRSSEGLWRLGIAGNLLHLSCAVAYSTF